MHAGRVPHRARGALVGRGLHERGGARSVPARTASTRRAATRDGVADQPLRDARAGVPCAPTAASSRARRCRSAAAAGARWSATATRPSICPCTAKELNVVIAGDMLLSDDLDQRRASGRSTRRATRCACSSSRSRATASCPPDVLVLPSHGKPFRGAHLRSRAARASTTTSASRS